MESREELRRHLAAEELRLERLEGERAEICARIAALRHQLGNATEGVGGRSLPILAQGAPVTAAAKVGLFRSLFRGREDVFPTRFLTRKTGKPGYAPACSNKFRRGVCDLPRVKCGKCPNQAFLRVDDRAILDHLRGRHVMGVYPLLADDTCWFLAADFDKASWREDVSAFMNTCQSVGVPVAVERSRSGNGAHAWFFFRAPVHASTARAMGCYLVTETMSRRHQLSMESYDRLFPNQDTLPRGGFGNLIALPLQYEARKDGNTLFLDEKLEPHPDQWAFLASMPRMTAADVEAIAREAARLDRVLGVRPIDFEDEGGTAKPWERPPSGRTARTPVPGPLATWIGVVLAQRIFVEKRDLPSPLLNQIQRLAAFQNPEFYKKQSMRLSTATTPRVIACAEDHPLHLALPRGCLDALRQLLDQYGASLTLSDQRQAGIGIDFEFQGQLTPLQEQAAAMLLQHETGVFVAPPGIGKTVLGTYLVAKRARSTLVLVHRQPLLDQWVAQLSMFLGIDGKEVGQIGGGKRKPNGRLDVAMIQSLVRKGEVADIVGEYGQVIVDECHHVPAVSFERVMAEVKARYVFGLTATPTRRDGHHPILEMQLGPIRFSVDPKTQASRRPFGHRLIVRETQFRLDGETNPGIQEIYRMLSVDEARNALILNDVIRTLKEGRHPILLTDRRDHLEYFAEHLRKTVRHVVVLHGGRSPKHRRQVAAALVDIPLDEERVILATGRFVGEGFDDPRLDTLFLAAPVSWKGTIVQYTGRLQRLHPGKAEVRIYDYVDRQVPLLMRMFEKRLRTYRAIGYARGDESLDHAAPAEQLTVEYDLESLRHFHEEV